MHNDDEEPDNLSVPWKHYLDSAYTEYRFALSN